MRARAVFLVASAAGFGSFPTNMMSSPPPAMQTTCLDTCWFFGDGECDDGGPDSSWSSCDLGTDCMDCGGRFVPPPAPPTPPSPALTPSGEASSGEASSGEAGSGAPCYDIDEGVSDSWGDSCSDYGPSSCFWGFWDDDDFTAQTLCCVCGGGSSEAPLPSPPTPPSPPPAFPSPPPTPPMPPLPPCYDSDEGALDTFGDACSGYYFSPGWCGNYDDEDFTSADMCCVCGGGASEPGSGEPSVAPPVCIDSDEGALDQYGDACSDYYGFPSWCGNYDDEDFTSADMCCVCGGGAGSEGGSGSPSPPPPVPAPGGGM